MAKKQAAKEAAVKVAKTGKTEVVPVVVDESAVPQLLTIKVGEQAVSGEFRTFSTGSKGWYIGGKTIVNGVRCQIACNVIIIGSKPTAE